MRKPCVDENGVKKGAWSEEEDNKLRSYILRYGHWNWRLLPKFAGLTRCGKSCRLRWVNYLKPGLKRGSFTKEEEDLIAKLHHELGNKWSAMAARLPGRTDNEIKNYWHTHLKKRSKTINPAPENNVNFEAQGFSENAHESSRMVISQNPAPGGIWDSEDSASSSVSLLSELEQAVMAGNCVGNDMYETRGSLWDGFEGSFWTQPFLVDNSYTQYHIHSFSPFMEELLQ